MLTNALFTAPTQAAEPPPPAIDVTPCTPEVGAPPENGPIVLGCIPLGKEPNDGERPGGRPGTDGELGIPLDGALGNPLEPEGMPEKPVEPGADGA